MTFHSHLKKKTENGQNDTIIEFFLIGIRHTKKDDAIDLSVFWDNNRFPVQHDLKSSSKEVLNEVLRVPLDLRNP